MKLFNRLLAPSPQMKLRLCVLTGTCLGMLVMSVLLDLSNSTLAQLPFWWKVGAYVALGLTCYCWTMNRSTYNKTELPRDFYKK